jgi:hypothetical protein
MLDHMILAVSNVERSLAFYEEALKPLNIKFFVPYKGEGNHPDLWGFGDGKRAYFWIKQGKPDPASIHWGFSSRNASWSMPTPMSTQTYSIPASGTSPFRAPATRPPRLPTTYKLNPQPSADVSKTSALEIQPPSIFQGT